MNYLYSSWIFALRKLVEDVSYTISSSILYSSDTLLTEHDIIDINKDVLHKYPRGARKQ